MDECHHISARSFEIVCRQAKSRYVTGLSAIPKRRDGCAPIIFMQSGPVRYRVDPRKYAADRPVLHRVIVRKTGFKLPLHYEMKDSVAIQDIYSALVADYERNNMIIDDILVSLQAKRSPVVLTERRDHLEWLTRRLEPMVRHLIVLSGGMGQKQRREVAEQLRKIPDDEERLIIATGRYLGEGFDDARLDTMFLTLPVSWRGIITQYAGRLHREHDMKKK